MITIPEQLKHLLDRDHNQQAFALDFLKSSSEILRDNRVVFFRGYTDHGIDHIERVLVDTTRLVPERAFLDVLTPTDACVIICSTILHDIALHLSEDGFACVATGNYQVPRNTALSTDETIGKDRCWKELWQDYLLEAQRWSDAQRHNVFGELHAEITPTTWRNLQHVNEATKYDDEFAKPLVGEFIRLHHARLAHEVALLGFPGLCIREFPSLAQQDPELADLVGFVARSHHLDIRAAADFVSKRLHGDLAPLGCHVAYCMGLLRVSDYLQIDDVRAPTTLLKLRKPNSPFSVNEWKKHAAVRSPSYSHSDREAIFFPVRQDHPYTIHLMLRELLVGLQRELDETNATLREVYRDSGELSALGIRYSRIRSNIFEPDFADRLPYVPDKIAVTVDPKMISLMISPLYGDRSECGIRELLQNAVDAVLEKCCVSNYLSGFVSLCLSGHWRVQESWVGA